MHPGTSNPKFWLSHKGCIQTMFASNGFYNEFKDLNLVTSTKHFIVLKVNFMLTYGHFVVTGFYFKSHFGQDVNNLTTSVIRKVCRRQVKIATLVIHFKSWIPIFIELKEEELWLWSKVERFEANFFHVTKGTFEVSTWVSCKRFPFCCIDITNQACDTTVLISPRENSPRVQVWIEIHIRLVNPNKPLDRRSIKHGLV